MRTIKTILPTIALLFLIACANLEQASFNTVSTIAVTVNTAREAWNDYCQRGLATSDQIEKAVAVYSKYQESMAVAQVAVTAYKHSGDKTQLQTAINVVSAAAGDFTSFVNGFLHPTNTALKPPQPIK